MCHWPVWLLYAVLYSADITMGLFKPSSPRACEWRVILWWSFPGHKVTRQKLSILLQYYRTTLTSVVHCGHGCVLFRILGSMLISYSFHKQSTINTETWNCKNWFSHCSRARSSKPNVNLAYSPCRLASNHPDCFWFMAATLHFLSLSSCGNLRSMSILYEHMCMHVCVLITFLINETKYLTQT